MVLLIQILIILILAFTLINIYIEEFTGKKRGMPHAVVKEIWLGEERRKSIRAESRLDAIYYYVKGSKQPKRAYTENISTGGMKIITEEKLREGIPLSFEINVPGSNKPIIVTRGEVVWTDDSPQASHSGRRFFGAGIKFTHIKPNEKERLSQFIKKVLASQ